MSAVLPRPLPPTFLPSLNALLASLDLPFTLDDPTDLTPSLLLAILESLIDARLPIPQTVRVSRTREAKARAMLVLLGVLECDVLHGWADEIGLGQVDPERLADGGWEETIFVGELLCWLARRKGILPRLKRSHTADFSHSLLLHPSPAPLSHITDVPRHPLVHSPEPSLSLSHSNTGTDLSIRARSVSSRTSLSGSRADSYGEDGSEATVHPYADNRDAQDDEAEDHPPIFRPHCIHELEDPSYIHALAGPSFASSASNHGPPSEDETDRSEAEDRLSDGEAGHDPYVPPTPTPRRVRLTGWIDESTRRLNSTSSPHLVLGRILYLGHGILHSRT
ncbi:hypothetical protein BU15DRAFT_45947 [Melanogaster broomeanus]|nr:hypothetical protein BU15DRAFT_45947 [Melanogaster broomeanus]